MLLRFALLIALAVAALGASGRLYLKDGDYQIVREYQVLADRVRYFSTERGDWEEIPLELVDLERTKKDAVERQAAVGAELPLNVWLADDGKTSSATQRPPANRDPVNITWTKYRGEGKVTFENAKPKPQKTSAEGAPYTATAATTAKFDAAGAYILQVVIGDYSGVGGGGFQCCWTTGLVKVTVK